MSDTAKKEVFKKYLLRAALCLGILGVIFLIGIGVFIKMTLDETSLAALEEKTRKEYNPFVSEHPVQTFEEGSIVDAKEFETFYMFASNKEAYGNFLNERLSAGVLVRLPNHGDKFQVVRDVKVDNLLSNDCKEIYCYQHYLPFDHMPSIFWKGLISVEDQRYLDHFGVDFKSLLRAMLTNLRSMRYAQGGSTISQQLVKNLFFTNEKTFSRKIKEIIVSIYLESLYTKEQILEAYLNEVHWGALEGVKIKGVYAASLFYFNKKPEDVTPFEGAILTGLLKGPAFYHPIKNLNRLKERAMIVYKKLIEEGFLPEDDKLVWDDAKWAQWQDQLIKRSSDRRNFAIWRTLSEKDEYLSMYERFVINQKIRNLRVKLDRRFKNNSHLDDLSVKIMIGTVNSDDTFTFYSRYERNKKKAINEERHQVGSTIKPIIYSVFEDLGLDINGDVSTEPIELTLNSGPWSPRDAHKAENPQISIVEALLKSYNRPVIRIANDLGFDNVEKELKIFFPELRKPLAQYPAQLLGSLEMSVADLFDSYSRFISKECHKILTGKRDEEDSVLTILADPNRTTVERSVDDIMQQVRFFGKTGTSNNGYDNWFVAFDGKNISIVWVGYEGERSTKSLGLYGATTAFDVYQNFFRDRGKRFQHLSCDLVN